MREEGVLVVAGFGSPSPEREPLKLIREFGVAGLILFARNIESPRQVASLVDALQREAIRRLERPLFIMVDQEGGPVARLRDPFTHPPSARDAASLPEEDAKEVWTRSAREMRAVGINVNLAPVADLSPPDGYMAQRSFGTDPDAASRLACLFMEAMQEHGVMACAKHFPGLGAARQDPHLEEAVIERSWEEMEAEDLVPFREAIHRELSFIMTSHGLYLELDPEVPGTLSSKIVTGLAREMLAFNGLIITDDLEMSAIKNLFGPGDASVAAVAAGADLALVCSGEEAAAEAFESLVRARENNRLPRERIEASKMRQRTLLIRHLKDPFPAPRETLASLFSHARS